MRSVVLPIIGINVLVFLLQVTLGDAFTSMFILDSEKVLMQPYRLLTSMFMHGSGAHIAFNMFGLLIFGPLLEQILRPKRFLYLYIGSGLLAAVVSSFLYPLALGASGAIFGMLGALIYLMPNLKILLFFVLPMPLWIAGILWVGLDIFGIFTNNNVANEAHLVGIAAGLLYGYYIKRPRVSIIKKPKKPTRNDNIALTDAEIDEYLRSGRL